MKIKVVATSLAVGLGLAITNPGLVKASTITNESATDLIFDAAADFSLTNNPNSVWQYGWSETLGADFNLFSTTGHLSTTLSITGTPISNLIDAWFSPELFGGLQLPSIEHNGTENVVSDNS
ncbi:MAG: hypothetical protein F6J92_16260 [Symploca sp. SIO1A3]|nr:hypothetical protein [Symploca sp. SIO1A3]